MKRLNLSRQAGLALPIMLIMLVIMLVSSVYLLKSSTSTALTTGNLAYEASLAKSADLGLLTAFSWLDTTAKANKLVLNADSAADGYVSSFNTVQTVHTPAFWNGSKVIIDAAGNRIEYVIHRMCRFSGAYDLIGPPPNNCMQTAANTSTLNNTVALGDSLASDASQLAGVPQVHYVVTSRISGPRGGNVINQSVVMIGA